MKKSNVNGLVLSEQEMREVKGGAPNYDSMKENLKVCIYCGEKLSGEPKFDFVVGAWRLFCSNCGSHIELPEM